MQLEPVPARLSLHYFNSAHVTGALNIDTIVTRSRRLLYLRADDDRYSSNCSRRWCTGRCPLLGMVFTPPPASPGAAHTKDTSTPTSRRRLPKADVLRVVCSSCSQCAPAALGGPSQSAASALNCRRRRAALTPLWRRLSR
ncbi:hypothetical protein EVAR_41818_1 [Eumeta japonica]|uniref:Uncharacterized protein n=1 Tax=Eumeta variegata TaxID=151549 RepID=A0A4C1XCM1_EUMVA|nr:hypothetical protein EVAR_41818_1 [Eumeta japonica]